MKTNFCTYIGVYYHSLPKRAHLLNVGPPLPPVYLIRYSNCVVRLHFVSVFYIHVQEIHVR